MEILDQIQVIVYSKVTIVLCLKKMYIKIYIVKYIHSLSLSFCVHSCKLYLYLKLCTCYTNFTIVTSSLQVEWEHIVHVHC